MLETTDLSATLRMIGEENLDVRTVTLGVNLNGCAREDVSRMVQAVYDRLCHAAERVVPVADAIGARYGVRIVNKRLAVSPASILLEGHAGDRAAAVALCQAMDRACDTVGIDLLGGFSALVHKGMTPGERTLVDSLPEAISTTRHVCSSINIGTTRAGINAGAVAMVAKQILAVAEATREERGFGAAKIVVFANQPEDNPFMAGAKLGAGEPDRVVNIGVSGPGVVKRALDRLFAIRSDRTLDEIAEEVKHTAYRVTRVGELIGHEIAGELGVPFGILDLALAPTPRVGDSVGEIYQAMGIEKLGAPGTTAAVMLLNDAVKKGGAFASSAVGGLSGAFIPVMEDHVIGEACTAGHAHARKARGDDRGLLRGPRHVPGAGRHLLRGHRRHHPRRGRHRRDEPEDNQRPRDSRPRREGGRSRELRRALRRRHRDEPRLPRGRRRLRAPRRPHPRAHPQPVELAHPAKAACRCPHTPE
jgi:uncharacterized protein (UPF0210 family)